MTDFVARLARKWSDGCPHIAPEWGPELVERCCLKAAISEALEAAEKICDQIANESSSARGDTAAAHCKSAIRALREGR